MLINTVLLERNRWNQGRIPSFAVSEWVNQFHKDGFTGIELWENHAAMAGKNEIEAIKNAPLPITIYNSYISLENNALEQRQNALEIIQLLQPSSVKFNMGGDIQRKEEYIKNLTEFHANLPDGCTLLCECHPGTIMEEPAQARAILEELSVPCSVIIHPFHASTSLSEWFEHTSDSITHAHVSLFMKGEFYKLADKPSLIQERLNQLSRFGFQGTFSLEFTEGVATASESIIGLYTNAIEDKAYLESRWKDMEDV
ncbi:hypothetical protein ACFFGV_15010 [Pontibacillus salicampi]|uniref:Sugar phosphate isomerase/epimerase n=1 Tax=Pontibacillus salicampi TaxID=1449801 RepID=A0ABV6LR53_9BACI